MTETTQNDKIIKFDKTKAAKFVAVGFVLGIVWFIAVRVILYKSESVHYHANFSLFIENEQEMFEESAFYEEVSSCGSSEFDPLTRVHMHDNISDVAHVHDGSVTWGNFLENLGFTLGDDVLYARTNTYVDGQGGKLTFMLNGKKVQSIAGKRILSEDKLLISYSKAGDNIDEQYAKVASSAAEYNQTADPSACSGSADEGFMDRLKIVVGL